MKKEINHLLMVILEWGFQFFKMKVFYDYLKTKNALGALLKAALVPLFVILLLAGIAGWLLKGHFVAKSISDREQVNAGEISRLKTTVDVLRQEKDDLYKNSNMLLEEKREKIQLLSGELNSAKAELGPWQRLAASIFTNEPPYKQMELLLGKVRSVSDELRLLGPSSLRFRVSINGIALTNATVHQVGEQRRVIFDNVMAIPITTRTITIAVRNVGEVVAENLTVAFNSELMEADLKSDGWSVRGSQNTISMSPHTGITIATNQFPVWNVIASSLIADGGEFLAPPLTISTNWLGKKLNVSIMVYANRSKMQWSIASLELPH